MNQSESIAKLAEALAKAQGIMEGAKRDSTNPFFKSTYSDLSSVWDACRKPLSDNGLSIVQTADFIPEHPDMVCIETMLCHASGEWIKGRLTVKPVKSDPQSVGSCITYLRRYSLQSIVGIAPEDDDGNAASNKGAGEVKATKQEKKAASSEEKKPPALLMPGSPLHKKLEASISEAGIDREQFKQYLKSLDWIAEDGGKLSLSTLTEARAKTILDKWQSCMDNYNLWLDRKLNEEA